MRWNTVYVIIVILNGTFRARFHFNTSHKFVNKTFLSEDLDKQMKKKQINKNVTCKQETIC